MAEHVPQRSSPALIAAAWLLVIVPTAWGLTYTVENALKIFRGNAPAAPPPAPVAAPAPQR